ncbi:hypothetical protein BESB_064880 [Besnoitia besnoiti]|uniref:WD domain, G-beta repeat-containing protein n=1 Tax=Besnoitia besnoiti TaxID=94643 RepID=A0A2A9MFT5_BESBE|nr:hypothetical protein BESB_064880 [Besnoitia besnoiti]PFH34457.1 hypothetical protein BESB_064880 [Besnoitia besnoiti]
MRVAPLLTLRSCSPDAAQGAAIGAATFLSASRLALGDTEGGISVFDLDSRRPCCFLPSSQGKHEPRDAHAEPVSSSSSWSRSPVLLLEALGRRGVGRSAPSLDLRSSGQRGSDRRGEDEGEAAEGNSESSGSFAEAERLLCQHRSSLVALWDMETLQKVQSFRTGSFSFCRLAVLNDPRSGSQEEPKMAAETLDRDREVGRHKSEKGPEGPAGPPSRSAASMPVVSSALSSAFASSLSPAVPAPTSPLASASPCLPLLACPTAEAEAIGIFDLRTRREAGDVAHPVVALRSPFGSSAAATSFSAPPCGMVQCIAQAKKLSASLSLVAAYEMPFVALWDLRQPRAPVSSVPLSAPSSSPPSALTIHRNQCWVGCFAGQISVLKIQKSGSLTAYKSFDLFADWGGRAASPFFLPSADAKETVPPPCRLPHPDGDLSRSRLLLSAAFRPDGALVAVGASDGGVRLFETKNTRCLGALEAAAGPASHGDTAGTASVLTWCPRTGVLASGGGAGGRIALWGLYAETFRPVQ